MAGQAGTIRPPQQNEFLLRAGIDKHLPQLHQQNQQDEQQQQNNVKCKMGSKIKLFGIL
jgi:SAM-dependent MidA family methyltransferase